jgi:hypothetical protein
VDLVAATVHTFAKAWGKLCQYHTLMNESIETKYIACAICVV